MESGEDTRVEAVRNGAMKMTPGSTAANGGAARVRSGRGDGWGGRAGGRVARRVEVGSGIDGAVRPRARATKKTSWAKVGPSARWLSRTDLRRKRGCGVSYGFVGRPGHRL